jgi:hypothetical protein
MNPFEFSEQLKNVNWLYQDIKNPRVWNESRLFYEKMLKTSWSSPVHRHIWIKAKNDFLKSFSN